MLLVFIYCSCIPIVYRDNQKDTTTMHADINSVLDKTSQQHRKSSSKINATSRWSGLRCFESWSQMKCRDPFYTNMNSAFQLPGAIYADFSLLVSSNIENILLSHYRQHKKCFIYISTDFSISGWNKTGPPSFLGPGDMVPFPHLNSGLAISKTFPINL
jgi:hypothetical protein